MQQSEEIVTRRELGDHERYLHNLQRIGGMTGAMVLEIEGALDEALLRRGLDWLQNRHPILQAHVTFKGIGWTKQLPWIYQRSFFETEGTLPIPLRIVHLSGDGALQKLIEKEIKTVIKFDNAPRMRATLIPNWEGEARHKLVLSADHSVADAQAVCRSIDDLMHYFEDPAGRDADTPRRGLPPAMESVLPPKTVSDNPQYQPAIRLPTKWFPVNQRQTPTARRALTLEQTNAIKSVLPKRRSTLNGLLATCLLKTLSQRYDLDEMTCLSSVEFRRMCKPPLPMDTYGCYIDILRTKHDVTKPMWDLAREISFALISTLARNQHTASLLTMPGWEQYRTETVPMFKSGMRLDSVAVTTTGEAVFGHDYGAFKLHDVQLSMALNPLGVSIFFMSFERQGVLNINMCYSYPNLTVEEAERVLDETIALVLETVAQEAVPA